MHSLGKMLLAALIAHGAAAAGPAASPAPTDRRSEVRAAVEQLRHDPNLGHDKTVRSLRWVEGKKSVAPKPADAPGWLVGFFRFFSQGASLLIWGVGTVGLAVAAIWVYRVAMTRRAAPRVATARLASRIQNLDITPGSLPADVGAAALALLEAGRPRDALSLLYRGALSRAVHRFAVNIGESYTEGEALRAVNQRLDRPRAQYFAVLVAVWQRAVYAADVPAGESIAALCREFSPLLDGAATA